MTDSEALKHLNILRVFDAPDITESVNLAKSALRERIERNNAQESALDTHWISVEDRLPERYGTYLVYLGMPDKLVFGNGVHTAWYYSGSKEFSFSLNTAKMRGEDCSTKIKSASVTHWMPLPEPPKEEKQ